VLVHPPAVTEPDEQIAREQAEQVVVALGPRDLLVPAVVAEEGDLGERDAEYRGGDRLVPGVADGDERPPRRCVAPDRGDDARGVVDPAAAQQSGGADLPRQGCEIGAASDGKLRARG
jgi:hypothetical protein